MMWLISYTEISWSGSFSLFQGLHGLNEQEEVRLHEILSQISDNVRRRRLMMYPYFKDYDRVSFRHFLHQ